MMAKECRANLWPTIDWQCALCFALNEVSPVDDDLSDDAPSQCCSVCGHAGILTSEYGAPAEAEEEEVPFFDAGVESASSDDSSP